MNQGSPTQIAAMAAEGTVDFAIATEALSAVNELVVMPCYRWNRTIIVPKGHPLAALAQPTLEAVASYPIVTYVQGYTGRKRLDDAFSDAGLSPRIVLTATDADVIKTYVRLGLGIGILAEMAYDPELDQDLVALPGRQLFEPSVTYIAFRRGTFLRRFMYEFLELFAPQLSADQVDAAIAAPDRATREALFEGVHLPER